MLRTHEVKDFCMDRGITESFEFWSDRDVGDLCRLWLDSMSFDDRQDFIADCKDDGISVEYALRGKIDDQLAYFIGD